MKLLLAAVVLLAVATTNVCAADVRIYVDGREYIYSINNPVTWHVAVDRCRLAKMQLVSFETNAKWQSIKTAMSNTQHRSLNFWTSGINHDSGWLWSGRAEHFGYNWWSPNEPNANENCMQVRYDVGWYSYTCSSLGHYMCEYSECCNTGSPVVSPDPLNIQ